MTKTASARAPTRDNTTKISITGVAEQRRVFACGVFLFMLYLLAVSGLFSVMAEWDYGTAFYFLFNSVALIGESCEVSCKLRYKRSSVYVILCRLW